MRPTLFQIVCLRNRGCMSEEADGDIEGGPASSARETGTGEGGGGRCMIVIVVVPYTGKEEGHWVAAKEEPVQLRGDSRRPRVSRT